MRKPDTLTQVIGLEVHEINGSDHIFVMDPAGPRILYILEADFPEEPAEAPIAQFLSSYEGIRKVQLDLNPALIACIRACLPEAALQIYDDSIPMVVRDELLAQAEEALGPDPKMPHKQRQFGAVRFIFNQRQLGIRGGIATIGFAMRDLALPPDVSKRYTALFQFCQKFVFRTPELKEQIQQFADTEAGQSIPSSMALIREYMDLICPEEDAPAAAIRHKIKELMLRQVQADDEVIEFDLLNDRLFKLDEEPIQLADPFESKPSE